MSISRRAIPQWSPDRPLFSGTMASAVLCLSTTELISLNFVCVWIIFTHYWPADYMIYLEVVESPGDLPRSHSITTERDWSSNSETPKWKSFWSFAAFMSTLHRELHRQRKLVNPLNPCECSSSRGKYWRGEENYFRVEKIPSQGVYLKWFLNWRFLQNERQIKKKTSKRVEHKLCKIIHGLYGQAGIQCSTLLSAMLVRWTGKLFSEVTPRAVFRADFLGHRRKLPAWRDCTIVHISHENVTFESSTLAIVVFGVL